MGMTRRDVIHYGLTAGGMLLAPISFPCRLEAALSPQIKRFTHELPILEPLSPCRTAGQTDYYEIRIQKNHVSIPVELQGGGSKTLDMEILGFNGITPGPLIRQKSNGDCNGSGDRLSVMRFINELDPTPKAKDKGAVIHLHGMNAVPYYDGYATDSIPTQYYKDYEYPNDCSGILWYHDHSLGRTSQNVYMGLAGMYLIEDDYELGLPLPKGKYDIPLVVQDRRFQADGNLAAFDDNHRRSLYGDMIFVNGMPWPKLTVERRKYRFRILNASVSRNYQFCLSTSEMGMSSGDRIIVIGSDEGLLERPVEVKSPHQRLNMGVAERYDVVIDFAQYPVNSSVYLRNVGFTGTLDSDQRTHTILRFDVVAGDGDPSEIPNTLGIVEPLSPKDAVAVRKFRFERNQHMWKINNKTWDENRVDANPKLGSVEIWEFINPGSGWVHPIHPHLVRAQVLDRNGLLPKPYERGWKDVIMVGEFQKVRIIARFGPHKGKYMMHCHNLVHEDHDMMTQFEVGEGGESPHARPAQPCTPGMTSGCPGT